MSDEYRLNEMPEPNGAVADSEEQVQPALSDSVEQSVSTYLAAMKGQNVNELYELVLSEIEAPLLAVVMKATSHNQSRASTILGLNRGTLRKKLKKYGLA